MNDITYAVSVDVNNPIIPYNVYVASVLDSNVRYLEITLYQNGNVIALSNEATATASLVTDDVLIDDSVECTISNNIITVPLEDLQRHGNLDVQVTVTEGTKVLAIPFPIQVRVTPNIAEEAQIDENSLGSYAEVVHEIAEARGTYTTLHDAITAKLDDADGSVKENNIADESITVEKVADDLAEVINAKEVKSNKKTTLAGNEASSDFYPSIKAVVDYLVANYEDLSNKLTSGTGINGDSTDTEYPTAKAVFDFGADILYEVAGDLVLKENLSNKKNAIAGNETSEQYYPSIKAVVDYLVANYENLSNKLTSEEGIDSNSTDTEYPTAKAVYDLGVEILALVNDDISNVESRLVLKESSSNKQSSITAVNKASTALYPSIKAIVDYLVANYENLSNKKTTLTGNESSNDFYPTTKAVADALLGINAGSVGFDETGTYTDGSIGAEISHQKNAIGQLGDIAAFKIAILQIAQKVVYIDEHGQDYYDDLYDALYPPAPLASISAVFVQGSTVVYKINTLDSLKPMLTVTATYADQHTEVVTDYTLSGTLSVGTSTITVSWGSKTDTFNVIVTERESYIVDFENMQYIEDTCVLQNGTTTRAFPGWCIYPPIDIEGYNEIEYTDVPAYDSRGIKVNGISIYDSNNNYIGYVGVDNADESVIGQSGYDAKIGGYNISGTYQIPTNAKYAVFGATRGVDRLIGRIPSAATLK